MEIIQSHYEKFQRLKFINIPDIIPVNNSFCSMISSLISLLSMHVVECVIPIVFHSLCKKI